MADAYLHHTVCHLPARFLFCGAALRPNVRHYVDAGVVRVIAGPEAAHVVIDIQRPYHRPVKLPGITQEARHA